MRNPIFDIMKFVAIIAMIVGHCVHDWRFFLVYPWHMPLFFIVSGYFFKPLNIGTIIKQNFQRLIIPYFISSILVICGSYILNNENAYADISTISLTLLLGGGNLDFSPYYGIGWFFVALFFSHLIYGIIYKYSKSPTSVTIWSIIVSCIGYFIGTKYGRYIPFQLSQACISIIFIHVGYLSSKHLSIPIKSHQWVWWSLSIIFLSASIYFGALDMFTNKYTFFPINILGAIGGTFIVMQLCYLCTIYTPKIALRLAQLGSISILIYIVHLLEHSLNLSLKTTTYILSHCGNYEQTIIEKILFSLIISLLLYNIPIVRRVFRLSKNPQYIDIKTSKL